MGYDSNSEFRIAFDFSKTFRQSPFDSNLQITRLYREEQDPEDTFFPCSRIVSSLVELRVYDQEPDICQIFSIDQRGSYARLNITLELFESLIQTYSVSPRLWEYLVPFSFKTEESDICNAPIRFKLLSGRSDARLGSFGEAFSHDFNFSPDTANKGSAECIYGFRYAEPNLRDNPDYDPWSIRQSVVYQHYDSIKDKLVIILISPSETMKRELQNALCQVRKSKKKLTAFYLHQIIISSAHSNWRLYIRSLEQVMIAQSNRVTLTEVQNESERLSPLKDFAVNFVDRQRLKVIEDKVLDLDIIFESLQNTISRLKRECVGCCLGRDCKDCSCSLIGDELGDQLYEAKLNMKKVDVLHKRAQGTSYLLSSLLDYENAQIAHLNEKSLNGLVGETKDENSKMRILTERSTQDAAAVRILTVITLIYLPLTVVANFFSTQLVKVDDLGKISVISEAWWLAVVAVPLTLATFLTWRGWLTYTMRIERRKNAARDAAEKETRANKMWSHRCESGISDDWA